MATIAFPGYEVLGACGGVGRTGEIARHRAEWDRLAINNNRQEVAVDLRFAWALLRDHEVLGTAVY